MPDGLREDEFIVAPSLRRNSNCHDNKNRRCHISLAVRKQRTDGSGAKVLNLPKKLISFNEALPPLGSTTFHDSVTNWGPSVQTPKPMEKMLHILTTTAREDYGIHAPSVKHSWEKIPLQSTQCWFKDQAFGRGQCPGKGSRRRRNYSNNTTARLCAS